jgi:hypothetical protein
LSLCVYSIVYIIIKSTITPSLQSLIFEQTDMLDHLITLLTSAHPVYNVVWYLLPHYRILHQKQQAKRLLQPQLKCTTQHVFNYLPTDPLSLGQPVHHLHFQDLHLLPILLVLAQLQIQVPFLLLSPLRSHRAFYDDILLDGGVGSGSVEVDLSLGGQSHHLVDRLYFGEFVFDVVPNSNCEGHEILVDLCVFDFYL